MNSVSTDEREKAIAAASRAMAECGYDFPLPVDGDLDDEERGRYDALCAAIDAAFAARASSAPAGAGWRPIETAWKDARVTGEQRTLFVAQFAKNAYPSFNCVYYDPIQSGEIHVWQFADGGGAYHRDWPTHWMFADDAAAPPAPIAEESTKP